MTLSLTIHSSKGGSGKTSIAINLAAAYASEGKNVCLIDSDIRGPSLYTYFETKTSRWINDFISKKYGIMDVVEDISNKFQTSGKFYVAHANPDIDEIRDFACKDRNWQSNALKTLISGKKELFKNGIDVIIFDTSPGVEYESINAVAASDVVLIVHNSTNVSLNAMEQLVDGVYRPLNKNTVIVNNMCHDSIMNGPIENEKFGVPILENIPCMCDIATRSNSEVLVITDPEHTFSRSIMNIKNKLERFQ
ncbi:ParA family protein [Methanolobus sp. ZRKC3]|uniref:ParA family protein n=1 Tax=Methanolobus sp. ZRKC3 TaxID=3125786 RepID=UPI00325016BB